MIDQQATAEPPGSKRLFYPPSLGKQNESSGEVRTSDNLDRNAQMPQRRLEAPHIGAISGYTDNPGEERTDLADQSDTAIAILHAPSVTCTANMLPWLSARM